MDVATDIRVERTPNGYLLTPLFTEGNRNEEGYTVFVPANCMPAITEKLDNIIELYEGTRK